MTTPDFLKEKKAEDAGTITEDVMQELSALVTATDEAQKRVDAIEAKLKDEKQVLNDLRFNQLPTFLLTHGISEMKLTDGRKVTIKEDISVAVKDNIAFRKFLIERGEDDIIKVNYNVGRVGSANAQKIADFLFDNDIDYDVKEDIHHQTKKKYFKELIADIGRDELPEWAVIYDIREAKIK